MPSLLQDDMSSQRLRNYLSSKAKEPESHKFIFADARKEVLQACIARGQSVQLQPECRHSMLMVPCVDQDMAKHHKLSPHALVVQIWKKRELAEVHAGFQDHP